MGNDTDPYQVLTTYTQYTNIDSSTPGYRLPNTLNNESLKPESTTSYELGLEMSFFSGRLGFDATYYSSETKDQIIPLSVSGTSGYIYKVINSGVITNKGMEFAISGKPIQTRNFTWETSLTLASNKNKVKKLIDGVDYYRITTAPFKVEIGAMKGDAYGVIMSMDEPYENRTLTSLIYDSFNEVDDSTQCIIPTVLPIRTFLEKAFLLNEEYQKKVPRSERMSRHLYDIERLMR